MAAAFSKKPSGAGPSIRLKGAKKMRKKELPPFTRQMGAMYKAGIPVVQSLIAVEEQATNLQFKPIVAGLRQHVEAGETFSEACLLYPEIFDELYVNMIRAGEAGGIMAETMSRMADYMDASTKMANKVKSAMMYPLIVLFISSMITLGIMIFLVPVFEDIYASFGAQLPAPTRALVAVSNVVRNQFVLVAAVTIISYILFARWKKSPKGGITWDRVKLKFPIFGDLMLKVAMARFGGTFAQLSRSGVPILKGLEITSHALGNKALGAVLLDGMDYVERGEQLSTALKKSKEFPPMMLHMLQAGEQTAMIDEMLDNIADMYEDEVNNKLAGLTSLIEPIMMICLGIMVAMIVVCLYLPIFQMFMLADM